MESGGGGQTTGGGAARPPHPGSAGLDDRGTPVEVLWAHSAPSVCLTPSTHQRMTHTAVRRLEEGAHQGVCARDAKMPRHHLPHHLRRRRGGSTERPQSPKNPFSHRAIPYHPNQNTCPFSFTALYHPNQSPQKPPPQLAAHAYTMLAVTSPAASLRLWLRPAAALTLVRRAHASGC